MAERVCIFGRLSKNEYCQKYQELTTLLWELSLVIPRSVVEKLYGQTNMVGNMCISISHCQKMFRQIKTLMCLTHKAAYDKHYTDSRRQLEIDMDVQSVFTKIVINFSVVWTCFPESGRSKFRFGVDNRYCIVLVLHCIVLHCISSYPS